MSTPYAPLEARLRHDFADVRLLEQALTHKSWCGDPGHEAAVHNEKLEFLGDAVVDLAIATLLMRYHPEAPEGVLTRRRASLVNQGTLAVKALGLGLDGLLRLGRSEECSEGRAKPSLLSDAFEAVLGALYLDAGWTFALEFVEELFFEDLCPGTEGDEACSPEALGDFKSALQELTQSAWRRLPIYTLLRQRGPEHLQVFAYEVRVGDLCAVGEGNSKKRAQQEAARIALELLRGLQGQDPWTTRPGPSAADPKEADPPTPDPPAPGDGAPP